MIRPFDWRDLPTLHRYRHQELCLDTALGTTRGQVLTQSALLSYLTPTSGIFTWVCSGKGDAPPLLGQISHPADSPFARLSFLAPEEALDTPRVQELLEYLAKQAGTRGAFHLLAEIDELATAFEMLRKAGFAIYARQRIWRILGSPSRPDPSTPWQTAKTKHILAVQALFNSVVPGLVGQIEPLSTKHLQGLVCYKDDQLIGYVDLKYGNQGIWAQPFIHPDVEELDAHLGGMIGSIPERRSRPIYLCVRTYQSWLEPALEVLDTQASPLQAVMVKRLAVVRHKVMHPFALPNIDGQTEVSAPFAQSQRNT